MRILLIDDDRLSVEVRRTLLEALGHEVVTAYTGGEGVEAFLRSDFHLTVLDLGLPDIPGERVLRHLRSMQANCRVIVLSGLLDVPPEIKADAVLTKGRGAHHLMGAIETLKPHP